MIVRQSLGINLAARLYAALSYRSNDIGAVAVQGFNLAEQTS